MTESARTPSQIPSGPKRLLPPRAILRLIAKGMSVRDVLNLFPELTREEVRSALMRVANLAQNDDASLAAEDPVAEIISEAQANANLSEEEAMTLAIEETNAARRERSQKR